VQLAGRWLKSDSGVGISFGQMRIKARYLGRRKLPSYRRSGPILDLEFQFENDNSLKISQYFLSKFSFDKLSLVFLSFALENFLKFCQYGFFEFKCGLSWNKQPILDLVRVSREIGILGLKNENPCFENFSGVPGSWFRLGGGEESQGFSEVKNSKLENGFLAMSSLDHKLSRIIFSFANG
jgi:hypothetical protein